MRRRTRTQHHIGPDPVYRSEKVQQLIQRVMRDGKKSIAEKVVYDALAQASRMAKSEDIVALLEQAIQNVSPRLEVRSRRVGGATYQVPREVRPERRLTLALRWIVWAARSRAGKPTAVRLAEELVQASRNEGAAWKKKEDMHRMAEANRAFAHFAW